MNIIEILVDVFILLVYILFKIIFYINLRFKELDILDDFIVF